MKAKFGYTGIRVRDLNKSVDFFTKVLGMKVQARVAAPWNKGEFVHLVTGDERHWLEINWYADDSPTAAPYSEGEQLDHLGFEVDDLEGALEKLNDAGYPTTIPPKTVGKWHFAFVKVVDDIWLDVYKIDKGPKKKPRVRTSKPGRR
jgi:lactoylglutathione lyase